MARLFIFGIDGVPFKLMESYSDQGIMPNFKKLRDEGRVFCKMNSSIPDISSVSWSTIISGKNPGEHGIFGFTDLVPGTYTLTFPNFATMKAKAFWESDDGKKYVIINVPSTYPAKPLNGCHVSGFVSLDIDQASYPEEFTAQLKREGYRIDVNSELGHTDKDKFMEDLFETLRIRTRVGLSTFDQQDWDVFFFVVTGSDRIGHFLAKAFADKTHPFHEKYKAYFTAVDDSLGKFLAKLKPEDSIMMMSDHGMEPIKQNVYLNAFLKDKGFLKLTENSNNYENISSETKAFALDPGRIYIHTAGRYPNGAVTLDEKEKIIAALIKALEQLEFEGEKVIDKVYRRDEIYKGPETKYGPDLVVMSRPGFNLKGALAKDTVFSTDIFEGKHTYDDSFFFVKSPVAIDLPDKFCVENVLQIIDRIEK
ncbi:alkaline phosphatase family protein [Candidatus Woesearchaeota archaeon]|nr:alkaline phosphatase family protein [Candidatus Woesearchaeota archaeon]